MRPLTSLPAPLRETEKKDGIMMSEEILAAVKHSFKAPSPFVKREGLRLIQGLNIITACAGSGKTALLSQLAGERKSVCISLGAEDNSTGRLAALFSQVIPQVSGSDDPYTAARKTCAYLAENSAALLVDNAGSVTETTAVRILSLIAQCSAQGGFTAVFAEREIPSYLLSFVMEGTASVAGAELLSFTLEETAELAALLGRQLSESALNEIFSFTGGWCIAVSELLKSCTNDPASAADSSYLPEYVESNIACGLAPELREALLRTALLQGDDAFCREALGLTEISALKARLIHKCLARENNGILYYPPVMSRMLTMLIPREEKSRLTEQASEYYIRNKRFAEAVRLFEQSGNTRAAERILALYGERLLSNCEFELIGYCGRIIGSYEGIKEPQALGALAQYHYYSGEYDRMEQTFNLADSMFGKENYYSVLRRLYNGLLRFDKKPQLYTKNILSSLEWLRENEKPMPFLYSRELEILNSLPKNRDTDEGSRRLGINRFGGLRLFAGDEHKELQCRTRRSAELIAFMLLHKGGPVCRDELLNAFWHDDMPANAVAMLHNMIYHLRRELSAYGLENIISYKNRYYTLDTDLINEEDGGILAVCSAADSGDTQALLGHSELLESYWGSYLSGTDMPWANERREYYDRCYVTACTLLSDCSISQGRPAEAEGLLRNAYRLEPFSEQIVCGLLDCYSLLGKPDKARECYEGFCTRLDEEFGTRPTSWLRKKFFSVFSAEQDSAP